MQNSLRLHSTLMFQLRKCLPEERITRLRNLAWLMTGLFLARSVHLSHIARKLPLRGQVVSLTNRPPRFLDNPRVNVWRYYRPIARQLLVGFCGQRLTLLIDCTALGFNYQLMVVAIANNAPHTHQGRPPLPLPLPRWSSQYSSRPRPPPPSSAERFSSAHWTGSRQWPLGP